MEVGVERQAALRVAEAFLHDFRMHALGQEQGLSRTFTAPLRPGHSESKRRNQLRELGVKVIALKAARVRKRRATGRYEGRKPYGTRPGEADVVALIHKLRRKPRGGERLSFKAYCTG